MEKEIIESSLHINRRKFLSRISLGLGTVALGSLLIPDLFESANGEEGSPLVSGLPQEVSAK